jgi:hypothetical protein
MRRHDREGVGRVCPILLDGSPVENIFWQTRNQRADLLPQIFDA